MSIPVAPDGAARGLTRRTVLCAGSAAGATAALAGCGGADGPTARTADDGTVRVAADDTAVGESTYYADARVVVTQPEAGDFRAFDAVCPHQGCQTSSRGRDGELVCPCHSSAFDPATGEVLSGPATVGLTSLDVRADGADLVIRG